MTLQIVQISDTHIALDAPQRLRDLENCVQTINELAEPPSLVIHTGDVSHNGTAEEYHSARKLLDKLDMPYFVMVGNRDNRTELLRVFDNVSNSLPVSDWVQYAIEQYPVRLLLVDTLNKNSNKGQLCD